jgi:hypothetical protein
LIIVKILKREIFLRLFNHHIANEIKDWKDAAYNNWAKDKFIRCRSWCDCRDAAAVYGAKEVVMRCIITVFGVKYERGDWGRCPKDKASFGILVLRL